LISAHRKKGEVIFRFVVVQAVRLDVVCGVGWSEDVPCLVDPPCGAKCCGMLSSLSLTRSLGSILDG